MNKEVPCTSEQAKKRWQNPVYRAKQDAARAEANRKRSETMQSGVAEQISKTMKKKAQEEGYVNSFLGHKHTEESKAKMSAKSKGQKMTKEWCENQSRRLRGTKQTKEHVDARTKSFRAWLDSEEGRKSIKSRSGENSCNWRGGITPVSMAIRDCKQYSEWRLAVYKRDSCVCRECGSNKKIQAHHIVPFSEILERVIDGRNIAENKEKIIEDILLDEQMWAVDNGITLCKSCHGYGKTKDKDCWRMHFTEKVKREECIV